MAFEGDLQEIGLTDVLQTLETNQKSGLLTVDPEGPQPPWRIAFTGGQIAAVTREGGLEHAIDDVLVRWGWVGEKVAREAFKRWQRARKKTLGRILVELGGLEKADYQALHGKLVEEEVLLFLAMDKATYSFTEGTPDWDLFDPEQLWAEVSLPVGPLVLEAARRSDEWDLIRRNVGSDHDLFLALDAGEGTAPEDDVQADVYTALDGSADFADLLQILPYTRFELAKALSDLVEAGWARLAGPEELGQLAEEALASGERERALHRLRGALEVHGHDTGLRLRLVDLLAELGREGEAAAELALAAQDLESAGHLPDAEAQLHRAIDLNPEDPSLRARSLALCLKHGSAQSAKVQGLELADLYLGLGVADRARKVLHRLLQEESLDQDLDVLVALADLESAVGRADEAASILGRMALVARRAGREADAETLYEKLLTLRPDDAGVQRALADIRGGVVARRKAKVRRWYGAAAIAGCSCLAFIFLLHEVAGRVNLARFQGYALEESTWGRPASAIAVGEAVRASHPFTFAGAQAGVQVAKLAERQLEYARRMVRLGRVREASRALVLLAEEARSYVNRAQWWPLLGDLIGRCAGAGVPEEEARVARWAVRRLTGLEKASFVDWKVWWYDKGSAFVPLAAPPPGEAGVTPPH